MKFSLFILFIIPYAAFTQSANWLHSDPETDSILGVSTQRAYKYMGSKETKTITVAIIDNGVELTHEDLQGVFWVNPNEIPNNGIDDDNNGYIDDINGWNFLGNSKGENLKNETTGLTRLYAFLKNKYEGASAQDLSPEDISEFNEYINVKKEYEAVLNDKKNKIANYEKILEYFLASDATIQGKLKQPIYTEKDVRGIKSKRDEINAAKEFMIKIYDAGLNKEGIEKQINTLKSNIETRLNPDLKNRELLVGDYPDDMMDSIYGNNMVNAKGPYHGTGVASIVGALNNDFGIDGIGKNVKLMILRIVPNGDERDKDIALAYRYAIRNGADIITCSFAKKYSMHHDFVQDAIEEAEKAGVLIVNAAGNNGTCNDDISYYPTGIKKNGEMANNFITVGASRARDNENLAAIFSNYGERTVDVFAPGFNIETCALSNKYGVSSGTSISAPVVAGIAAVVKSYYPFLNAKQLKEIILASSYKPKTKSVIKPGQSGEVIIAFEKLSISGGIANLYRALLLVEKEY